MEPDRRDGRLSLPARLLALFAVACGLSVANVYYAQPLLGSMADDLAIDPATVGLIVTVTQIGYGLGLILIVPLGDLVDRRRLIIVQAVLSSLALVGVAVAPTAALLLAAMLAVGLGAVVVQVLVAAAANLAEPAERGRAVGVVTSGVVLGILLARFVAGTLADLGGWRLVYLTSAAATLLLAVLMLRYLPRQEPATGTGQSYGALLHSTARLFVDEPMLRIRGILALLIFAAFNILWTAMVLPLSAPPFSLSHTEIGMFGLAGVAGALAAGRAGRWADRGLAQRTTGLSLMLMLAAWAPIALIDWSLLSLVVGIVMLDLAIQAVHVTNQSVIFAIRPQARSRLVAGYMVFYAIGSASGSIASTMVYAAAGWLGVCTLGAAVSATALLFFLATRQRSESASRIPSSPKAPAKPRRSQTITPGLETT